MLIFRDEGEALEIFNCILDDARSATVRERSNDIPREIRPSAARNFPCFTVRRGSRGVLFLETFLVALETIDFVPQFRRRNLENDISICAGGT